MTRISHAITEVTNLPPSSRQPYVGVSAFAHKAGLHASAIKVDPDLYQHIAPGGSATTCAAGLGHGGPGLDRAEGQRAGFDLASDRELLTRCRSGSRSWRSAGYTFEAADASFELLLAEMVDGHRPAYFEVESWRSSWSPSRATEPCHEATVKLLGQGRAHRRHGGGQRPGQRPGRSTTTCDRPGLPGGRQMELIDYKVRILDQGHGTDRDPGAHRDRGRDQLVGDRRRATTSSRRAGRRCSTR